MFWKEQNARIFDKKESLSNSVMSLVEPEANKWMMAGAKPLASSFFLLTNRDETVPISLIEEKLETVGEQIARYIIQKLFSRKDQR
jgi:hypothetical protein